MQARLIDARWLQPPEPMELTLAALETLGERIRLLIHREPCVLFQILDEWGYEYLSHLCDDGTYDVLIWYKEQIPPQQ